MIISESDNITSTPVLYWLFYICRSTILLKLRTVSTCQKLLQVLQSHYVISSWKSKAHAQLRAIAWQEYTLHGYSLSVFTSKENLAMQQVKNEKR